MNGRSHAKNMYENMHAIYLLCIDSSDLFKLVLFYSGGFRIELSLHKKINNIGTASNHKDFYLLSYK